MRHVWSVFCKTAITDRESNSVSLLECVEAISARFVGPELPQDVPLLCKFVTLWARSESDTRERRKASILVEGPRGGEVREFKYEVDLSEHARVRGFLEIGGIPYDGNGTYEFVVRMEDDDTDGVREVARIPVQINIDHQTDDEPG